MHASAVVVGQMGIAITGPSGSGKSSLALALIDLCRIRSVFATVVSDDQIWAIVRAGRLMARAPDPIAGLVEMRGYGPAAAAFERCAVIDRLVALGDPAVSPRYRQERQTRVLGVDLPCLELPSRHAAGNCQAIMAWVQTPLDA